MTNIIIHVNQFCKTFQDKISKYIPNYIITKDLLFLNKLDYELYIIIDGSVDWIWEADDHEIKKTIDFLCNPNSDFNIYSLTFNLEKDILPSQIQLNAFAIKKQYLNDIFKTHAITTCFPRLGKINNQYDSCFIGILSCDKYKNRRDQQNLKGIPFPFKYFIGNNNLTEPLINGDIVYLPCKDSYEELPIKVLEMVKWVKNHYPNINYLLKTDDDIVFDFDKMIQVFSKQIIPNKMNYCGNRVEFKKSYSNYHQNKCDNQELNSKLINMDDCVYSSGGGYVLSTKAMDIIIDNLMKHNNVFEDYSVGYTLNKFGYFPIDVNSRSFCKW